ncbi:MAG: Ubiquinone biosynthesis O-methyltransferase [Alphaproteobacteria bacterium MarineAlpha2_Bin1]|nr:MAG: Ubiquinone biosynthesis O-methyltransferase [Alphaproteobacteria bacterium MarineAlpha2_Bin1]
METNKNTIDQNEISNFSSLASKWWDPDGPFKPLHNLNPTRILYIRNKLISHYNINQNELKPLKNLRILDIGCGGGILSEPMARLGGEVVGVDPSEKNIKIAKAHSEQNNLSIDYINSTAEQLVEWGEKFDVILNMEVVEHVNNIETFISSCYSLMNPGGIMFIATLNRTLKSYFFAIIGAEYILKWLPKGTHDWNKFVKPSELRSYCSSSGFINIDLKGMKYNPLRDTWGITSDLSVNYIGSLHKKNVDN